MDFCQKSQQDRKAFRETQSLLTLLCTILFLFFFKQKKDSKHLNQQGGFPKGYSQGGYFCFSLYRSFWSFMFSRDTSKWRIYQKREIELESNQVLKSKK